MSLSNGPVFVIVGAYMICTVVVCPLFCHGGQGEPVPLERDTGGNVADAVGDAMDVPQVGDVDVSGTQADVDGDATDEPVDSTVDSD